MSGYDIGLSGLDLAQRAIDLIGTNIANATTKGYHRQDLITATTDAFSQKGSFGGVEVVGIKRNADNVLESELLRQQVSLGQVSRELTTLQTIESTLGTVDSSNLSSAITGFFSALRQLAAQPDNQAYQQQALWSGQSMSEQFSNMGTSLMQFGQTIHQRATDAVQQINSHAEEIAKLNNEIQSVTASGGSANLLRDRRDQAIQELSSLADVQIQMQSESPDMINVIAWGTPLVMGTTSTALEVDSLDNGKLGVAVQGSRNYMSQAAGGEIGGMLSLQNTIIPDLTRRLDTLARQIMGNINEVHSQGLGQAGSFAELTGASVPSGKISTWDADVKAGDLFVRVIKTDTGEVARTDVGISPDDTLANVITKLQSVQHLSVSQANGAIHISAADGYKFDFLPSLSSHPYDQTIAGTARPTISGAYSGSSNAMFTCTVQGSGTVGLSSDLKVQVKNQAGEVVKTIDVGAGYAAGDQIDIGNGINVAINPGTLSDGDVFRIQALASSDTAGILPALGLNTFFTGNSATSMSVRQELIDDPTLLATSSDSTVLDGHNVARMADVGDQLLAGLGGVTPGNYFNKMASDIGQMVVQRQDRQTSIQNIVQQLNAQRDTISGVDVNQETAQLLIYEQMYQSMAKYVGTQDKAMSYLMDLL